MFSPSLSIRSVISKEVNNAFQKFELQLTRPQVGNLREMAVGMLESGSTYLAQIANVSSSEVTQRKVIARYENHLDNIDHYELTRTHILANRFFFSEERKSGKPVLIIPDNSDIQKRYSQKQELICGNIDGSEGHKSGRGYWTTGLMAYGTESKKILPLAHNLFSPKAEDYTCIFDEQKKYMDLLTPLLVNHPSAIVVEDSIGDDNERIKYYRNELGCGFIVRLANVRKLTWKRGHETFRYKANELAEQIKGIKSLPRRWYSKQQKTMASSCITWTTVSHPDLVDKEGKELPLYVIAVYSDIYADPLLLLTDQRPKNVNHAWELFFFYKKRWNIETFFEVQKQEFGLEKIKIEKYSAIQTLVTLSMLAYCVLLKIHEKQSESFGLLMILFRDFCRIQQRSGGKVRDTLAFLRHALKSYPAFHSHHFWRYKVYLRRFHKHSAQPKLPNFSQNW